MTVETPVFDTSDKRLQPEYATGFLLSREIDNVNLVAGHFPAFKNQNSSSGKGDQLVASRATSLDDTSAFSDASNCFSAFNCISVCLSICAAISGAALP